MFVSQQQQQPNEYHPVVEASPAALAPISPRQEALSQMAEKKRQKWMREKGECYRVKMLVLNNQRVVLQRKWIE